VSVIAESDTKGVLMESRINTIVSAPPGWSVLFPRDRHPSKPLEKFQLDDVAYAVPVACFALVEVWHGTDGPERKIVPVTDRDNEFAPDVYDERVVTLGPGECAENWLEHARFLVSLIRKERDAAMRELTTHKLDLTEDEIASAARRGKAEVARRGFR